MIESPAYELLMQMAREDVRQEVEKDVEAKLRKKALEGVLAVLNERFGPVPFSIRESLEKIMDMAKLDWLLKKAATTKSLEEFERIIHPVIV